MAKEINTAFPEEKRPMMYKMMKWWGGKPHSIWSRYIETYSKKGDIVLDPFCGRGVGVIEAARLGRRAIGMDLNPIAIFQSRMISVDIDVDKIKAEWKRLKKELKNFEKQSCMFYTVCTNCHAKARLGTTNRKNDKPYVIYYCCTCQPNPLCKDLSNDDLSTITKSESVNIPWPYPTQKFPTSKLGNDARRLYGASYDTLFTRRNLYALACIFECVNKITDNDVKELFQFAFISMVHLASKFPSVRKTRVLSGSWGRPGFIKLGKNMELNPFMLFERAIEGNQGIIKGKTNSSKRLKQKIKHAKNLKALNSDHGNLLLLNQNTLELDNTIPKNSVDYVITDPPYGGLIQYFDLSSVWSVWLELYDDSYAMKFDDEITVDDKKHKPFAEYNRMLSIAFGQIYRALKPKKYMTVTFHNDKPMVFNSVLRACQDHGFVLEKILFQMNRRPGEAGAASPWGTSISDFYLRFFKPKQNIPRMSAYVSTKFASIARNEAKKIIAERGEPTEIAAMIPAIYTEMGQKGMLIDFKDDEQLSSILHGDGDFVELEQGQWWLSRDALSKHKLQMPLSERVETAILSILRTKYKVTYDEVLQSIFEQFPNSLTPNSENVKEYLNHYAKKTSDGKWKILPDVESDKAVREHTKHETILCQLGHRFGYSVYCADKSRAADMEKICDDFNIDVENADRVKQIDVLWIKDGAIRYIFEVENSTSITSALERCSNVNAQGVKRMIVMPKARDKFLTRKMKEPMFADYFKRDNWSVLWYENLQDRHINTEDALMEICTTMRTETGRSS